jgi:site-specific DNA-methyltransferase (adenine-specific)
VSDLSPELLASRSQLDLSWSASAYPRLAAVSGSWEVVQRDAVDYLRGLQAGSVDLVITDPPYESLEKHRAIGTTTRLKHSKASSNDWFQVFPNARFPELFREVFRVLRKNAHFYLFCDQETMFVAKPAAEDAGFRFWKPLVWDKQKIGMGYHYRSRYELILFFEKGKRKLNSLSVPDVLECSRIFGGYPTEKPAALPAVLVNQSSTKGELVVDPFLGSGSTGVAALQAERRFRGCDICAEAIEISRSRLGAIDAACA